MNSKEQKLLKYATRSLGRTIRYLLLYIDLKLRRFFKTLSRYLLVFPFYLGTFAAVYVYNDFIYKTISIPTHWLIVAIFIYLLLVIIYQIVDIQNKPLKSFLRFCVHTSFLWLVFVFSPNIDFTDALPSNQIVKAIVCVFPSISYLIVFMIRLNPERSRSVRPFLELLGSVYLCLLAFGLYYTSIGLNSSNSMQSSLFVFLNTNHLLELNNALEYNAVLPYVLAMGSFMGYLHFALFIGVLFQYSNRNK